MIDNIHLLQKSPQLGAVTHIPARKMDIRRERMRIARGKIIQPADLVSLAGEMIGKRRAEESRGSGDEKVHGLKIISETTELSRLRRFQVRNSSEFGILLFNLIDLFSFACYY